MKTNFHLSCFFEQMASRPANSGYALAELQLLRPRSAYALSWICCLGSVYSFDLRHLLLKFNIVVSGGEYRIRAPC